MSNKLRDLFDDSKQEIAGKVSFDNSEKYELFVNAVDKAIKEGKPITVDGIANLTISYCDGKSKYPISETNQLTELRIYPNAEMVEVDVLTDQGPKKLKFMRYYQEDKIVLDSVDGKGASINISYDEKQKHRAHPRETHNRGVGLGLLRRRQDA